MPLLLAIGIGPAALFGAWTVMFIVRASFDLGTYTVDAVPVPGHEFLRGYGLMFIPPGFVAALIAWAIWRELPWSRAAILYWWVLYAAICVALEARENGLRLEALFAAKLAAVGFSASAWYLYRKLSVVAYFQFLQSLRSPGKTTPIGTSG